MTAVAVFFNPSLICLSVFNKYFSLSDNPLFIGLFRLAYWAGLAGHKHGFAASHTWLDVSGFPAHFCKNRMKL